MGFCNWSMFSSALPYAHSGFVIILMGRESWLLCVFVFLVSRDCCVALPHSVIGLSAVGDCGIF